MLAAEIRHRAAGDGSFLLPAGRTVKGAGIGDQEIGDQEIGDQEIGDQEIRDQGSGIQGV
jgi:hypothetical protein